MSKKNLIILILLFLISCSGFKDAGKVLRNEKITTTDEFLIQKRNPLVLPPDYEKIPEPGSVSENKKDNDENKIKKILKTSPEKKIKENKSSTAEESILKNIRK